MNELTSQTFLCFLVSVQPLLILDFSFQSYQGHNHMVIVKHVHGFLSANSVILTEHLSHVLINEKYTNHHSSEHCSINTLYIRVK